MADEDTQESNPNHYVDPATGVLKVKTGTPGFAGSIVDLMRALASSYAPKAITQRAPTVNTAVNQAAGLGNEF
jgi:hypothetical protein